MKISLWFIHFRWWAVSSYCVKTKLKPNETRCAFEEITKIDLVRKLPRYQLWSRTRRVNQAPEYLKSVHSPLLHSLWQWGPIYRFPRRVHVALSVMEFCNDKKEGQHRWLETCERTDIDLSISLTWWSIHTQWLNTVRCSDLMIYLVVDNFDRLQASVIRLSCYVPTDQPIFHINFHVKQ